MKLTIVSPEKILYKGEAQSVTVLGTKGQFEVLDHHAPIISSLQAGRVAWQADEAGSMDIMGGFIEVAGDEVSVCVEA